MRLFRARIDRPTRNVGNAFLTSQLSAIETMQTTYAASHSGRYWQGLPTHSAFPAHTDTTTPSTTPDQLTVKPTDIAEDWTQQLPAWVGVARPVATRIDVYQGPQGHGYVVTIEAKRNGQRWRRSVNVGPDTARNEGWHSLAEVGP